MNIKDSYLHGGSHVVKNINFSIAASGTNQNKLVATITWAEEGSSDTELAIPISGATFGSQTKNTVFAAPNGSNGVPSFRALVAADIPNISANKITSDTLGADRLPLATNSAKGAVILGAAQTSDQDSAITGKKYWVQMNTNGKLFVHIPWTDTTYKLTINGTTNGSGSTSLGTLYAVATSDATAKNQVWMRNNDNTAYEWRTLGSRAFDNTSYIPLAGSSTTSPITGTLYIKDADGIYINSNNLDKNIWHIVGNSGSWDSQFGFNLQYLGTASGNDNDLVLWAHKQSATTHVEVYRVHQDGSFIFKSTPKVDTTLVSLEGHKHAYTDLTGSTTTADQAIVSSGTANGWTLKTLGSRAFDSTAYVPIAGGMMTGTLIVKTNGTNSYNQGIRINRTEKNKWATLLIGKSGDSTEGKGTSTAGDGAWLIGTPPSSNSLIFNLNNGSESIGLCLKGHGTDDMKWNDNTVYHAGNIPSNSASAKGVVPAGVASLILRLKPSVF